jgi:RNA polymerase sigma factor (sigma-70 family)
MLLPGVISGRPTCFIRSGGVFGAYWKVSVAGERALARLGGAVLRIQPDRRLVTLLREGHGNAFDEIVRRYRHSLVAFAAGYVPGDRAEDVVQDGLASAYSALRAGSAEIALRPWLYTIVRNRALNVLRDTRAHEELDEELDGVPQPPDLLERQERIRGLLDDLHELPTAQREAIVKRELGGASHEQIAAELETSPAAVRQLIYRARVALRNGAGLLLPLPLLRSLLEAQGAQAATAAGGIAAGGAAAAGGGGAAVAVKAGVALSVAAVAVGSGVALRDGDRDGRSAAAAADSGAESRTEPGPTGVAPSASSEGRGGPGPSGSSGSSGSSGAGEGESSGGLGSSGSEDGDDGEGDAPDGEDGDGSGPSEDDEPEREELEVEESSGPGGRSGSSGSGSNDAVAELDEAVEVDNSGSGSSGSGGSGSATSGSGTSGSGSSGSGISGSSGSGSGGSVMSGSGSSGGSSGSGSSGPEPELDPD